MMFDDAVRFDAEGNLQDITHTRHGLADHRHRFGKARGSHATDLLRDIESAELTGRGGGHFPVARKLRPIVESGARTVVINGSEGEILSSKDAALLQLRPHLVLDGAQALARAVRASEVVVWLHAGADASLRSVLDAIAEREADSRGAGEVRVQVMLGPARYLTGEASTVINGVRGRAALPSFVPDPAKPWVDGDAVLVHNVETHARIGLLEVDAVAYAPTSLVTLALESHRIVVEVPPSTSFRELFAVHGVEAPVAVLLGGFGGQWVRWDTIAALPIDPITLRERTIAFGAGIIAVPPKGMAGLAWSAEILHWMAGESAGQCGPCIFGLPELAKQYTALVQARRVAPKRLQEVRELMHLVEQRGACRHPDGAVRMARSALDVFDLEGVR